MNKFERRTTVGQGTKIPNMSTRHFLQYSADNVDHNMRSIDGKGTFHGMGIIAMVTPLTKTSRTIPKNYSHIGGY